MNTDTGVLYTYHTHPAYPCTRIVEAPIQKLRSEHTQLDKFVSLVMLTAAALEDAFEDGRILQTCKGYAIITARSSQRHYPRTLMNKVITNE